MLGLTRSLSAVPHLAGVFIPGVIGVGSASPAFGLDFVDAVAEFPARDSAAAPLPIDTAWLDGADLVVLETAYAGRVSRTLTVDGFRMR